MVRYVNKQKEASSCTPIALVNALKWAGYRISWRDKKHLLNTICGTNKGGTIRDEFKDGLKIIRITFTNCHISRLYKNPSIKSIKTQLAKNRSAIISFCYIVNKDGHFANNKKDKVGGLIGHSFFVEGIAKGGKAVYTHNFGKGKVSLKTLEYYLTHHNLHNTFDAYRVWFITKKG